MPFSFRLLNIELENLYCHSNCGIRKGLCTVFVQHTSSSLNLCENVDPDLSALANRPHGYLAGFVQIEKPSRGFRLEKPFERAEPYLHTLRRRKTLRNTGDDHLGAVVGG